MKKLFILSSAIIFLSSVSFAQPDYKALGGVWIGQTSFTDGDETGLNVGSFFLAKTPLLNWHLYFGNAISATTEVVVEDNSNINTNDITTMVAQVIPIEANLAYVIGNDKFKGWIGGGINLSIAQAQATWAYYDSLNGIYCNASVDASTNPTYGAQIFIGGEYIFGEIKYIGGMWGVYGQYKYQYISEVDIEITGNSACIDSFGNTYSQSINQKDKVDLSNNSFVIGLSYHF